MILSVLFGIQFNEAKHHSLWVFKKRLGLYQHYHWSLNDIQWCCIQETNSLATIEQITAWRPVYICLSFLCGWKYKLDKFFKNLENIESVLRAHRKNVLYNAFHLNGHTQSFCPSVKQKARRNRGNLMQSNQYHKLRCIWQTPSLISKTPICDFNLLKSQRCGLVKQGE